LHGIFTTRARGRRARSWRSIAARFRRILDSELFGHERGAFTGALASKVGWFEAANKGTLFLDEVADLPLAGQVKLLRVLQEREVVRVGSRRASPVDVRLIAATNVNLRQAVAEGRFREDLFYRLHVAHVTLSPLRDRREDILPLANHFLARHASRFGIDDPSLSDEAAASLLSYDWPGNIRELENAIQRSLLWAPAGRIGAEHVRLVGDVDPASDGSALFGRSATTKVESQPPADPAPSGRYAQARAAIENALVVLLEAEEPNLLEQVDGIVFRAAYRVAERNQVRTARLLGISRNIVRSRLMRHGLLAAVTRRRASADGANENAAPSSQIQRASEGP